MNEYVVFLVIGALAVLLDGWLIYRSGQQTLVDEYDSPVAAQATNRLITTTFVLVLLAAVALISTTEIAGGGLPNVVTKLGILLLLLAIAHGAVTVVLNRVRDRQRRISHDEEALAARRTGRASPYVTRSSSASATNPDARSA